MEDTLAAAAAAVVDHDEAVEGLRSASEGMADTAVAAAAAVALESAVVGCKDA